MLKSKPKIDYLAQLEKDMVFVEKGSFLKGKEKVETVIEEGFYICKYVVTQGLWKAVMGENNNPSSFKGDNRPVEEISWNLIENEFLPILNSKTKNKYRFPLEKEWEFAANAGKKGNQELEYSGSNNLKEVGWYRNNSNNATHPVGLKLSNSLGLYDMSGNVFELCQVLSGDLNRVLCGGSWELFANFCRSSKHINYDMDIPSNAIGLRLVRD